MAVRKVIAFTAFPTVHLTQSRFVVVADVDVTRHRKMYAVGMAGRIHRNLRSLRPRRLLWNMYAIEKPRNAAI